MNELTSNGTPATNTAAILTRDAKGDGPNFAETKIGTVPAPPAGCDPRAALDAVKRATIVALVRLDGSRRMAAAEVGCAHRTIARTAARDPQFAAELAAAESQADHKALKLIDRATDQEKYWRAAAWVLERRNPEEIAPRAPRTMTHGQVLKLFTRFLHGVLPQVPAECRDAAFPYLSRSLRNEEFGRRARICQQGRRAFRTSEEAAARRGR
jgi:hypothetical protein